MNRDKQIQQLKEDWAENPRWKGVRRGYSAEDVIRLRGSVPVEHSIARRGAERLWRSLNDEPFINLNTREELAEAERRMAGSQVTGR